jgi:hypothetical protein
LENQQVIDQIIEKVGLHVEADGSTSRQWPFESILFSVLPEQEKALVELRAKLEAQKKMSDR